MKNVLELAASGTGKGHIRWTSVKDRVPDDRRRVLAWGTADLLFGAWTREPAFLGVTRFNPGSRRGRGIFDCEDGSWRSIVLCKVTHWAEIVGPQ